MKSFSLLALSTGFAAIAAVPALAAPPGYITAVLAGLPDPNAKLPAFNAVQGAGVKNLSVAVPVAHLLQGQTFTYLIASQNNDFTGNCTASYELMRLAGGTKKILDSATITTYACNANLTYSWAITGNPVPNSPGPAQLVGMIKYGAKTMRLSVPVVIR